MIKTRILFLVIILTAFVFRLYRIDAPVADWHSWRQANTAAVARNFIKLGFDPLRPRADDLSNSASGVFDNPKGYFMVEFPLYQTLGFFLYQILKISPLITIEICLRLITVFSSLGVMLLLYQLTKQLGKVTALFTITIFGFLPYSFFYSRAILPEMLAVFLALCAVFFFPKSWVLAGIAAGLAILTKPTAGFLLFPLIYFCFNKFKLNTYNVLKLLFFILLSSLGFILWRIWINQFPEGIPQNAWLLNGDNIRFSGAYFYWLLGERLAKLISGYWLVVFLVIGLISRSSLSSRINTLLLAGTVLYTLVFARGNVQHDYYQILWLPILAIFSGQGIAILLNKNNNFNYLSSLAMVVFCFIVGIFLSWREIRTYYWINNPAMVEAGLAVDKLVPKDAKVIAPYGGDTAFLYQTNRQGWPVGFEIEKKISLGADYYVNTNVSDPETQYVLKKWTAVFTNDRFVIVKLR